MTFVLADNRRYGKDSRHTLEALHLAVQTDLRIVPRINLLDNRCTGDASSPIRIALRKPIIGGGHWHARLPALAR